MTYSVKTTDLNTTITVATGEVNTKYGRKYIMDVGELCKFYISSSKG